ncbi:calcium load-activated calcium channel [Citrus sinensis]|nr:calcium load-activated calcium channel [Citrus sinensis]
MAWKEEEAETEALDELAEPLIYQINSYKFLKSSIDKASKKLKTIKIENLDKISTKTIVRSKTSRKECSHDLSLFRFEFDDIVTLVQFEGKVIGKLLFKPFGIVMKMCHLRLQGDISLVTVRDLTSMVVTDRDLTGVGVTDRDLGA